MIPNRTTCHGKTYSVTETDAVGAASIADDTIS